MVLTGQVSLYDYWLENFSYGAQLKREGYTNVYDAMPKQEGTVNVIDRAGNRFKAKARMSFGQMAFYGNDRGYEIVWWKEWQNGSDRQTGGDKCDCQMDVGVRWRR